MMKNSYSWLVENISNNSNWRRTVCWCPSGQLTRYHIDYFGKVGPTFIVLDNEKSQPEINMKLPVVAQSNDYERYRDS